MLIVDQRRQPRDLDFSIDFEITSATNERFTLSGNVGMQDANVRLQLGGPDDTAAEWYTPHAVR